MNTQTTTRRFPSNISCLGLALASIITTATALTGAQPGTPASPPPPPAFRVQGFQEKVGGQLEVSRGLLVHGTNQLSFVIPPDYIFRQDSSNLRMTFEFSGDGNAHGHSFIVIQLKPLAGEQTDAASLTSLQANYPDSSILGEFAVVVGDYSGPGVELKKPNAQFPPSGMRVAVLALPGALMEISQTTELKHLDWHRSAFGQLMNSFRIAPVGTQVEFQPIRIE